MVLVQGCLGFLGDAPTVAGGVLLTPCFFLWICVFYCTVEHAMIYFSESVFSTGLILAAHILHHRWTGFAYSLCRTVGITPLSYSWLQFQKKANVAILPREQQLQSPCSSGKQEAFSVIIEESWHTQWQPTSFKIHKYLKNWYASSHAPSFWTLIHWGRN